jgi:uncharacterized protein (TIGR03067 family)
VHRQQINFSVGLDWRDVPMEVMSKLVLFLFLLTVGKSPDARREFAQIKGEWKVVRAEMRGEKVPAEALAKKVIFQSSNEPTKQPVNSLAFSGRLSPAHTPKLLELSTVSILMEGMFHQLTPDTSKGHKTRPAQPVSPIKRQMKTFAIYQITGDTMKLLVTPEVALHVKPPKNFVTTKEGGEFLLELRRKPR